MKVEFEIRYVWKYISEDGLLKEPRNGYGRSVNDLWEGFETEESAIRAFTEFHNEEPYAFNKLVLLKEFRLL